MNSFKLPYHLIVDEGVFGRIPKVMNDVIPGIENKKTIIVTESTLKGTLDWCKATIGGSKIIPTAYN